MPSTGFYPFLHGKQFITKRKARCVNALNGLLSISTYTREELNKRCEKCVNALNGLLSISTDFCDGCPCDDKVCQCPQRASIHFYWNRIYGNRQQINCVNALNGLLSISTKKEIIVDSVAAGVNALNGLLSIST